MRKQNGLDMTRHFSEEKQFEVKKKKAQPTLASVNKNKKRTRFWSGPFN